MIPVLIVGVLAILLIGSIFLFPREDVSDEKAWDRYLNSETSQAQRMLSRAARPLASLPLVQNQVKATKTYRRIESQLRGSGVYAGSLEVFLAVQFLMIIIAIAAIGIILITGVEGLTMFVLAGFALVLVGMPYNKVHSAAKKRAESITASLPDFAELLIMVLPSYSIPVSLAFTSERITGPVADEVKALVRALSSRTLSEQEAFQLAADRLGTPEARAFMTTLMNAHLEGTKALDAIKAQAESMRKIAFQNQRAQAKKLPTKMVFIFGLHFMPALFIIALMPLALGLGNVLG